jgi:hypothetical protein
MVKWITMLASLVSAGAAAYGAILATKAASTWRRGLEYQRLDAAIIAVLELRSKIDRTIALMDIPIAKDVWDAYTEAWYCCSRFEQAHEVLHLYPSLSKAAEEKPYEPFAKALRELKGYIEKKYNSQHTAVANLKEKVWECTETAVKAYREATPRYDWGIFHSLSKCFAKLRRIALANTK